MGASPKPRRRAMSLKDPFPLASKARYVFKVLICGGFFGVALLQTHHRNPVVWVPLFLVPAFITLATVVRLQNIDGLWIRCVSSVYTACTLCFLVFMVTQLVIKMATRDETFLMYEKEYSDYNPLKHQEGWDCLALVVVILWLKFLTQSTKANMRELGLGSETKISSRTMLRTLGLTLLVPIVLFGLTCAEPWVVRVAKALQKEVLDTDVPIINNAAGSRSR